MKKRNIWVTKSPEQIQEASEHTQLKKSLRAIDLGNIGTLFAFVLVSIGVIVLRRTKPDLERRFRTPGVPFNRLLTVGFCFYLMYSLQGVTWLQRDYKNITDRKGRK